MCVVIVKGMRRDAIGKRSSARRHLAACTDQARSRAPVFAKHEVADKAAHRFLDAGKGNNTEIEERQDGNAAGRLRYFCLWQVSEGEKGHPSR